MMKEEVFSGIPQAKILASLFTDYYKLHQGYKGNFYLDKSDLFQQRVNEWKIAFLKIFHKKLTTIYMHTFTDHVAELIKLNGDIDIFNIQG
jgi:hypothetical protein